MRYHHMGRSIRYLLNLKNLETFSAIKEDDAMPFIEHAMYSSLVCFYNDHILRLYVDQKVLCCLRLEYSTIVFFLRHLYRI